MTSISNEIGNVIKGIDRSQSKSAKSEDDMQEAIAGKNISWSKIRHELYKNILRRTYKRLYGKDLYLEQNESKKLRKGLTELAVA